jgi:ATPase family associated with various cellular activities (AAA)/ATP-dependent Clp protease adaptor protein ClpS
MKNKPDWLQDLSITIYDDDESPFEGVTALLRRCIGFGEDNATAWARHIDRNGSAKIGPWCEAVARGMFEQLQLLAPRYSCHSLRVSIEGDEQQVAPPKPSTLKAHHVLGQHFLGLDLTELTIVRREFPAYLRVDVQRAIEALTDDARRVGIHSRNRYDASDLAALLSERDQAKLVGALQFDDIDIGEDAPVRLPTNCLTLFSREQTPIGIWVNSRSDSESPTLSIEIVAPPGDVSARITALLLEAMDAAVAQGRSYRGKVLSLEASESYRGLSATSLTVHYRARVEEHELVLPASVRGALERHIVEFAANRSALLALGQSGRKGVLLYGPPGTGKTHTIRYLAQRLSDHTTFLVTAEQIGLIATYFRLARLFAPAMIVIEDADLIARQREDMNSACDEVMLNRLLNEMDGLRRESEIFVLMTTNRPETLEAALLQRPGRIDHAIEVPVPDADCRAKLFRLYGHALEIDGALLATLVDRSEGVSAAFIKEIARRLAHQSIAAGRNGRIEASDLNAALGEMLSERDGLNLRLLGGMAERAR